MRVQASICSNPAFFVQHAAVASGESLASLEHDATNGAVDDMAVELHECIVWDSGVWFAYQLPEAFISTAAPCQR